MQGQSEPLVTIHPPPLQPVPPSTTTTSVVLSGAPMGCPVCHNNRWTGSYSCWAWLWCICCFPCGIICCLHMRKKKCANCGFSVGR